MVILNDYLYSGDTVLRILHNYIKDLRKDAKKTGNEILPQFEVCLPTEEMQRIFEKTFSEWTVLKSTVVDQQYDIPRDSGICELKTSVVTFVAKKG